MLQTVAWLILAAVHALPAFGLFRPATLTTLYGVAPQSPLFLLLQHRAGLFLAVLAACLWAAFDPAGRRLASVVVAISMISFLMLYFSAGSPVALRRIAVVDMAGIPVLAFAAWHAVRAGS